MKKGSGGSIKLAAPSAARPTSGEARVLDSKSFPKHWVIDKIDLCTIECRLYVLFQEHFYAV
jgi:hypothetical protein